MTVQQLRIIEESSDGAEVVTYRKLDERTRRIGINGVRRARAAMYAPNTVAKGA